MHSKVFNSVNSWSEWLMLNHALCCKIFRKQWIQVQTRPFLLCFHSLSLREIVKNIRIRETSLTPPLNQAPGERALGPQWLIAHKILSSQLELSCSVEIWSTSQYCQGVKMKGSCTSFKTWLYENLLLILTFSGVVTGNNIWWGNILK